jgi:hypothetical protein
MCYNHISNNSYGTKEVSGIAKNPDVGSWSDTLVQALVKARKFIYGGESDPLYKLLGREKFEGKEIFQARLIKLIKTYGANDTEIDILLMSLGLLRGYEDEKDVGNRRRRCIDRSDYFKHENPEDYGLYVESKDECERKSILTRATNRLAKMEHGIMRAFADAVESAKNDGTLHAAAQGIKGYTITEKPYKVIYPEPSSLLKVKHKDDRSSAARDGSPDFVGMLRQNSVSHFERYKKYKGIGAVDPVVLE